MGHQIHVVGDRHTAIYHSQLFYLEEGDVEIGRRGLGVGEAVVNPETGRGVQLASYLYLLCQSVAWKRDGETVGAGRAPDRNNNVGEQTVGGSCRNLGRRRILRPRKIQNGLGLALGPYHSKVGCEQLSATEEVLTGSPHSKTYLLYSIIPPSFWKSVLADLGGDAGVARRIAQADDDVFESGSGRDNKGAAARPKIGKVLGETSIILNRDRLDLTIVGICVI